MEGGNVLLKGRMISRVRLTSVDQSFQFRLLLFLKDSEQKRCGRRIVHLSIFPISANSSINGSFFPGESGLENVNPMLLCVNHCSLCLERSFTPPIRHLAL